jgi:hypothetical protein
MVGDMPETLMRHFFPDFFRHRRRWGAGRARYGPLFDSIFLSFQRALRVSPNAEDRAQ